jgi:hypothetical protein
VEAFCAIAVVVVLLLRAVGRTTRRLKTLGLVEASNLRTCDSWHTVKARVTMKVPTLDILFLYYIVLLVVSSEYSSRVVTTYLLQQRVLE